MQDIENELNTITVKVAEAADKFIFEVIKPYCEYVSKKEITKKDLEQALSQYFSKEPCNNGQDPCNTCIYWAERKTPPCRYGEPCEDTISRAEAINQMEQSYNILDATDRIKALPPVTPMSVIKDIKAEIKGLHDLYKVNIQGHSMSVAQECLDIIDKHTK